ncbi:MAG: MBOAT family protein, partial [Rhodospirillaceae bacterium]|nr:MBOAT family protein [Rhodospirillaceae bacterium]
MQFNSFEFIYVFLPIVIIIFFSAAAWAGTRTAVAVLVISSLFYYGWWEPVYLLLISGSILFNYIIGYLLVSKSEDKIISGKIVLIAGICGNLGLLGYFKYANFFVDNFSLASGVEVNLPPIILPIAISFFTFQQIAYLVDCRREEAAEYSFMNYVLFVTFFPQLLAGPIVHHREMMPQFSDPGIYRVKVTNLAVGLAIFGIGILKKVVIADQIAPLSDSVFNAVHGGATPTTWEAWAGASAFSFQLYFDFSAYSDMAIGLARMLGIVLPLNFFSPYKAVNIIDFWRRWHITLSRFLRDYLYIPIGGSRHGAERRYLNILITMLIGGLWHGA